MYYCGIDIAKHSHELSILDETGENILSIHITNSQKGLEKLLNALKTFKIEPEKISVLKNAYRLLEDILKVEILKK